MSASDDGSSAIVSRMRELRSLGQRDVNQLHAQAERVTDWREHVRAQPVLSALAATAVGYSIARTLAGNSTTTQPVTNALLAQVASRNITSTGLLSLVGGIALSVGRQWVTEYFNKQFGVHAHAANQSTRAEQFSTTNPSDSSNKHH